MRRLLTALLTCGVVAAGLSAVAEPVSAEAAPISGLSVGEGWVLPPVPEGQTLLEARLVGESVWARLQADIDGVRQKTLWSTPSDGSGAWTQYPGLPAESRSSVLRLLSAGGSALSVWVGPRVDTVVISSAGEFTVPDNAIGFVAPGGRLVHVQRSGTADRVLTLDGEPLLDPLPTHEVAVDGSRVSWAWGDELRSRDLLDGGPETRAPLAIPDCSLRHERRDRWARLTCRDRSLLIDTTGALGPQVLDSTPDLGEGFLLRPGSFERPARVSDPITLETIELPGWVEVRADSGDHARVVARSIAGELRVMPVLGLADEPAPDAAAPVVTLDPLPRTLLRTRSSDPVRIDVGWTSSDDDLSLVEYADSSGPSITRVGPWSSAATVWAFPRGDAPCVRVRGTDRAGNVGPWDEHCFAWDDWAPREVFGSPLLSSTGAGRALTATFRGRFTDESDIVRREFRVRRADRSGRLSGWSSLRRSATDWVRVPVSPGHRVCAQVRATDAHGRTSGWMTRGCVTAPYDDASLRRVGPATTVRLTSALGDRVTRFRAGSGLVTPAALEGDRFVLRLRTGPGLGRVQVFKRDTLHRTINTRQPRPGWLRVEFIDLDPAARIRLVARGGPAMVDYLGVRDYDDQRHGIG